MGSCHPALRLRRAATACLSLATVGTLIATAHAEPTPAPANLRFISNVTTPDDPATGSAGKALFGTASDAAATFEERMLAPRLPSAWSRRLHAITSAYIDHAAGPPPNTHLVPSTRKIPTANFFLMPDVVSPPLDRPASEPRPQTWGDDVLKTLHYESPPHPGRSGWDNGEHNPDLMINRHRSLSRHMDISHRVRWDAAPTLTQSTALTPALFTTDTGNRVRPFGLPSAMPTPNPTTAGGLGYHGFDARSSIILLNTTPTFADTANAGNTLYFSGTRPIRTRPIQSYKPPAAVPLKAGYRKGVVNTMVTPGTVQTKTYGQVPGSYGP